MPRIDLMSHLPLAARCLVAAAVLAAAGCTGARPVPPPLPAPPPAAECAGECAGMLQVTYIGSGGFLIRHGEEAVLTGGMVSNPHALRVAWWWGAVRPDTALLDSVYAPLLRRGGVRAIVVGHSHYDHLMEVPYVARRYAPEATVFGDSTAYNLVSRSLSSERQAHAIPPDSAALRSRPGRWYRTGSVRIMALQSEHAPNFRRGPLRYTYSTGHVRVPQDRTPRTGRGWRGGHTYAYLIDFLGPDGSPVFRVHYQDAASSPPWGFPPLEVLREKSVDLAVVCQGNFRNVRSYPDGVIHALRPRHVVVGHWEDFFRTRAGPPRALPFEDMDELARRLRAALPPGSGWATALPGGTLHIAAERVAARR